MYDTTLDGIVNVCRRLNSRVGNLQDYVNNDNGLILNPQLLPEDYRVDESLTISTQYHIAILFIYLLLSLFRAQNDIVPLVV